ncbi:fumarylacetoacetate hydrolase family protein [Bryobacter aggregatus]|uniref:fumarylacetoacetate hydrolase family protein n=1 Tax=Bryobacter aggregatus TaxID=360054 RepID=UPI00068F1664
MSQDAEPTTVHGLYGLLEGDQVIETGQLFGTQCAEEHRRSAVRLLPPVLPSKIICVGRNYVDHAKELGNDVPTEPLIFLKPQSSLITNGDSIVYPPQSSRVDFEGEIGLVISKRGRNIKPEDAWEHVFGYTCVNDITARDLQKKDGQWTRGKGFDTFCSVGPWMVSKEDFDLTKTTLRTKLNGELKQEGTASQMIFDVGAILAFVSSFLTLEPGDLIATGTPAGVGPMQPGDQVTVEVEGLGSLTNTVIKG